MSHPHRPHEGYAGPGPIGLQHLGPSVRLFAQFDKQQLGYDNHPVAAMAVGLCLGSLGRPALEEIEAEIFRPEEEDLAWLGSMISNLTCLEVRFVALKALLWDDWIVRRIAD